MISRTSYFASTLTLISLNFFLLACEADGDDVNLSSGSTSSSLTSMDQTTDTSLSNTSTSTSLDSTASNSSNTMNSEESDHASSSSTDTSSESTATETSDGVQPCTDGHDYEPNNTPNFSCLLGLSQQIRTSAGVGMDTHDYYAVNVQAGHIYGIEVDMEEDCGYQNFELTVFDGLSTDTPVLGQQSHGGTLEITAFSSGTALIEIKAECSSGVYGLRVLPSIADGLVQDAMFEPNNIASHAHHLNLQENAVPLTVGLESDRHDYFSTTGEAGKVYAAEPLSDNQCGYNSFGLTAFNGATTSGTVLLEKITAGTFAFTPIVSGPILLDVWSRSCQTGQYSLRLLPHSKDGLLQDPNTYEPNNVDANAFRLDLAQETTASSVGVGKDLLDYYYLDLSIGKYFVNVTHDDDCGYGNFMVTAYGGDTVKSSILNELRDRGSMEITTVTSGALLVEVRAKCTTGIYKLSVTKAL